MDIHQAILEVLKKHVGKENRISRRQLRYSIDIMQRPISDREMRATIEELRREHPTGALICSSSGSGGYWLAENYDEIMASYQEERRRALTLLQTMRKRIRTARQHFGGQMGLGL